MNFRKIIISERGSLAPLWAIGGLFLVISILWVENFSTVLLKKYRDITLSVALSRTSLLENGQSKDNLRYMTEAVGSIEYQLEQTAKTSSLDYLKELVTENKRLAELLTDRVYITNKVEVPFTQINKSLGVSPTVDINTSVQTAKVFRPLNVVLTVESTFSNRENMSLIATPLENALRRLFAAAPSSRLNIVPYSYRVNVNNKCYTGIRRGDNFDFQWWEMYYGQIDELVRIRDYYDYTQYALVRANDSMWYKQSLIISYSDKLQRYEVGSAEYRNILNNISHLDQEIRDIEASLPDLQDAIVSAKKRYKKQQEVIEDLKREPQYIDYKPLADHYHKHGKNYKYFEDYNDTFANSGIFSIKETNFLSAVHDDGFTYSPQHVGELAVTRGKYFGDTNTCPGSSPVYDLSSVSNISYDLNRLDYSGKDVLSLEGILWAGRTVYSSSTGLSRNIIFMFVSGMDDAKDPDGMVGVKDACQIIKSSYLKNKVTKLIIVAPDEHAAEKFSRFSCATEWFSNKGYIILDNITDNFSRQLEELFINQLSQESTTKNAHY